VPSVTEIPQGTDDLVRSLPNNSAPGGRLWTYDIDRIRYLQDGVPALLFSSGHCGLSEAGHEAMPYAWLWTARLAEWVAEG